MKNIVARAKTVLDLLHYALRHNSTPLLSYNPQQEDDLNIVSDDIRRAIIPKKIWMYWEGNNIPDYIRLMVERISSQNPDHQLTLLNEHSLSDYITPLNFTAHDIPLANKSDIIRLEILKAHGGIWIDASTLFWQDLSWVHQRQQQGCYDLIGFYRDVSTINRHYPVIESWFLCAPAANPFITRWLEILTPLKALGAREYYRMMLARDDYADIAQKIHKPDYLLVYLAQQIALRQLSHVNLYVKRSEANAFMYQERTDWDAWQLARYLCLNHSPATPPPLIKLNSANRRAIEVIMRLKLLNKKSIIGDLYSPH
ncbi:glycosyltransferase family 32 protein [Erwinia sp. V71]|uniref:glycosyltransferase family 32 protein n=1 Tax=Erwinia sp. V71 TaxID=3369424 RepID=UPI003F5DC476